MTNALLTQQLFDAIRVGNVSGAIGLIEKGVNPLEQPTMLIKACEIGSARLVEILLSKGLTNKKCGGLALCAASSHGYLDIVKLLVGNGAKQSDGGNAIARACHLGHIDVVKFLLAQGFSPDLDGSKALVSACVGNYVDLIALLLTHGASFEEKNGLAVRTAFENGHVESIELLLKHGATLDVINDQSISVAVIKEKLHVIPWLLDRRTDLSPQSLLKMATGHNSIELAKMLLGRGAKPNMRLKMSDEIRDLFISHQQKDRLSKSRRPGQSVCAMEPGL